MANGDIVYRHGRRWPAVVLSTSELERVVYLNRVEWVFTLTTLVLPLSFVTLWWRGLFGWVWPVAAIMVWVIACQIVYVLISRKIEAVTISARPSVADFMFRKMSLQTISESLATRYSRRLLRFCAFMSLMHAVVAGFAILDAFTDLNSDGSSVPLVAGIGGALIFGFLAHIFTMAIKAKKPATGRESS